MKRKSMYLASILLCAGLLLQALFIGGCGETTTPERVDPAETTVAQGGAEPVSGGTTQGETVPASQTFAIGETVRMGDIHFTVNYAIWGTGNDFHSPEAGARWLTLDCTFYNTGDKPLSMSSLLMFKLYDEDSYARDMEIFAPTKGSLDGEVGPKRKSRGQIVFTVDADQSHWEFIFEPNLLGFGQAMFEIPEDMVGVIPEESKEAANILDPDALFAIGDTVKMGDIQLTVNSARWDKGNSFSKPEKGQKWLVLNCTIENTGEESLQVSSLLMFKLYDMLAYARDYEIFADTKGSLDGEVSPGRKIRGEVAFNVDADQDTWEFIFEPNVFGYGQAIFLIESGSVQ